VDGTHDLGGLQGFGPVVTEGLQEPPFHQAWEGRVHGTMVTLLASRGMRGSLRYAIERMGGVRYLTTSYYEHWLAAMETLLDEAGTVPRTVLAERIARAGPDVPVRADPELAERVRTLLTRPRRPRGGGPAHRFAVGDEVRVRRDSTTHGGHTRCPRYVRGVAGVVTHLRPPEAWPEGLPDGRIDRVPCYTVRFRSTDLWGPTAEAFTVTVDLVEPYLEEIGSP
jgi:nitrile hydratase